MGPLTNMYSGRRQKAAALRGIREQEGTATADREHPVVSGGPVSEGTYLAVEGVMDKTWESPDGRFPLGESNDMLAGPVNGPTCLSRATPSSVLGEGLLIACESRAERIWAPAREWLSIEWVWEAVSRTLTWPSDGARPTSLSADSACSPAKSDVITCFIMSTLGKSWNLAPYRSFHGVLFTIP